MCGRQPCWQGLGVGLSHQEEVLSHPALPPPTPPPRGWGLKASRAGLQQSRPSGSTPSTRLLTRQQPTSLPPPRPHPSPSFPSQGTGWPGPPCEPAGRGPDTGREAEQTGVFLL